MRALVGMLVLALGGCDTLWASYITLGDFILDGGMQCGSPDGCDLGGPGDGPAPDLQVTGCTSNAMCDTASPYCDLNTGQCTAVPPSIEAFPSGAPFETIITLNNHYVLLATGDYNGDGITDIAVSGQFSGGPNANNAGTSAVDIYLGDGAGKFNLDKPIDIPNSDAPVYLLTVPNGKQYSGLLVATLGPRVYYCSRTMGANGFWSANMAGSNMVPTGFKQLALAKDENQTFPDLLIRTSRFLYLEMQDPSMQGSLDVRRTGPGYSFGGMPSQASSSGIVWATPLRFNGAAGDTLALTWDDPVDMQKRGLDLYYTDPAFATTHLTFSPQVFTPGTYFNELKKPLRTTALLRTPAQDPLLLVAVSQMPNYLGVLTGKTALTLNLQGGTTTWPQPGLMLAYTGDANDDGTDEIGLYSMALNTNPLTRRLQILSFKDNVINVGAPILDIAYTAENVRGMSLEYLGAVGDRRRSYRRKDLIALIENPTGSAQLVIRRANLNYQFP